MPNPEPLPDNLIPFPPERIVRRQSITRAQLARFVGWSEKWVQRRDDRLLPYYDSAKRARYYLDEAVSRLTPKELSRVRDIGAAEAYRRLADGAPIDPAEIPVERQKRQDPWAWRVERALLNAAERPPILNLDSQPINEWAPPAA